MGRLEESEKSAVELYEGSVMPREKNAVDEHKELSTVLERKIDRDGDRERKREIEMERGRERYRWKEE